MVQKQVQNRLHAPLPCTLTVLRYLHFCKKCLPQWTHQPSKTKINVSRQDCVSTNVGYDVWSTARQTDCLNKPATVTLLSVMSPGMRFSAVSSLAVGDWLANVGRQSYLGKTACLPLLGLPVWRTRAGCVNARHHLQYTFPLVRLKTGACSWPAVSASKSSNVARTFSLWPLQPEPCLNRTSEFLAKGRKWIRAQC